MRVILIVILSLITMNLEAARLFRRRTTIAKPIPVYKPAPIPEVKPDPEVKPEVEDTIPPFFLI